MLYHEHTHEFEWQSIVVLIIAILLSQLQAKLQVCEAIKCYQKPNKINHNLLEPDRVDNFWPLSFSPNSVFPSLTSTDHYVIITTNLSRHWRCAAVGAVTLEIACVQRRDCDCSGSSSRRTVTTTHESQHHATITSLPELRNNVFRPGDLTFRENGNHHVLDIMLPG